MKSLESDFIEAEHEETREINAVSTEEHVAQESDIPSSAPSEEAEASEAEASRGKVPKLTLADLPSVAPSLLPKPPSMYSI